MFGASILNLAAYSAVILLVWWAIGKCSGLPTARILDRWKKTPLLWVGVKNGVLPLAIAPMPVPQLVRIEGRELGRGRRL